MDAGIFRGSGSSMAGGLCCVTTGQTARENAERERGGRWSRMSLPRPTRRDLEEDGASVQLVSRAAPCGSGSGNCFAMAEELHRAAATALCTAARELRVWGSTRQNISSRTPSCARWSGQPRGGVVRALDVRGGCGAPRTVGVLCGIKLGLRDSPRRNSVAQSFSGELPPIAGMRMSQLYTALPRYA